ncbi:MAG: hypothetical protein A2458_00170 [Candidatus Kerfeldbacteria bacterium RIFOXYC2_FULL_38_9]|nr:MAG: hypothetical protein A2458_00170 [Candidatus Kerfeldbacteria bacterium RIFOXYC2_FULL_38_9]
MKKVVLITVLVILIIPIISQAKTAYVKKVINGNTFIISSNQKVRLFGVKILKNNKCYAEQSTKQLQRLIQGKGVKLKIVNKTTNSNIKFAYVYVSNKLINKQVKRKESKLLNQCSNSDENFSDSNNEEIPQQEEEQQTETQHECSSDTYNCSNFSTHDEAQIVYDYCVAQGHGDVHRLDGDNNGVACESLP